MPLSYKEEFEKEPFHNKMIKCLVRTPRKLNCVSLDFAYWVAELGHHILLAIKLDQLICFLVSMFEQEKDLTKPNDEMNLELHIDMVYDTPPLSYFFITNQYTNGIFINI